MTWFKILHLKAILDRKGKIKDFDNVKIQKLYFSSGIRRIGFFKGSTHMLSVYSTEPWPYLDLDDEVFDLKPRHPFSIDYSICDQETWVSAGDVL
jgi:hypothetical protein